MELAARKQKILSAIVESFIHTGEPVGSKALINETGLDVSSATVRNEMADLTNKGFLIQPHTSAGRVPTAQAYRYYVDNIMKVTPVAHSGREKQRFTAMPIHPKVFFRVRQTSFHNSPTLRRLRQRPTARKAEFTKSALSRRVLTRQWLL